MEFRGARTAIPAGRTNGKGSTMSNFMTIRGLFYLLVAAGVTEKTEEQYRRLVAALSN
jgi:hypothetical protein